MFLTSPKLHQSHWVNWIHSFETSGWDIVHIDVRDNHQARLSPWSYSECSLTDPVGHRILTLRGVQLVCTTQRFPNHTRQKGDPYPEFFKRNDPWAFGDSAGGRETVSLTEEFACEGGFCRSPYGDRWKVPRLRRGQSFAAMVNVRIVFPVVKCDDLVPRTYWHNSIVPTRWRARVGWMRGGINVKSGRRARRGPDLVCCELHSWWKDWGTAKESEGSLGSGSGVQRRVVVGFTD